MIKDPTIEKERLLESSEQFKKDFENEFSELTGRVERGLITGLVMGGIAYIAYKAIKSFTKTDVEDAKDNQEKVDKPSSDNSLSKVTGYIAQTIALLLINLAKEKLLEYLNERKQTSTDDLSEYSEESE